ncbi:hypothetical protein [Roseivirga sp.]|uniref:hypothetical protein n=1 Tax=Roseivirga sp. TaxID=1964215 RepID=UPI003B51C1E0
MIKKTVIFIFLTLAGFACSDSDIDVIEVEAVIEDVSNEAGFESCEWLISFNGTRYKPSYLPPSYQVDGLQVYAKVELLSETANCNGSLNLIRIEQISPAN